MNKIKTLLAIILSVTMVQVASHGDSTDEHQGELFKGAQTDAGKVVSQFHQALKNKNKSLARQLLADDVIIFEGGGVERSADEYAGHHMLADMNYLSSVSSKTLEHQVYVDGDMAVSIARTKMSGTYKNKNIDFTSMETITLQKLDGHWKITHIHWSN